MTRRNRQRSALAVHGIQRIVDQVEKNLLHLRGRNLDRRKILLKIGLYLHHTVFSPLGGQGDQLLEQFVNNHILEGAIGFAGKAQQFVGDLLAAFALGLNLVDGAGYFRQIFGLLELCFLQQISYPTGFLHHDGDRVVNFMGHTSGQFTHGSQLAGFNHFLVHHLFFIISFADSINDQL